MDKEEKELIHDDLKKEAFAQAYIDNAMNGTKAMLSVSPHLTPKSAATAASRMLKDDDVQERIKALTRSVQEQVSSALHSTGFLAKAIAQAERTLAHADTDCDREYCKKCNDLDKARKFVLECLKVNTDTQPKEVAHKHAHLHLPKR